jgi:hypothetical protein
MSYSIVRNTKQLIFVPFNDISEREREREKERERVLRETYL